MNGSVVEPWMTSLVNVNESGSANGIRREKRTERHVNECAPTTNHENVIAHTKQQQNGNHAWIESVHGTEKPGIEIEPPRARPPAVGRSTDVVLSPTVRAANTTSNHTKPWMLLRWPTATTTASASNVDGAAVPSSQPKRRVNTRGDCCVSEITLA